MNSKLSNWISKQLSEYCATLVFWFHRYKYMISASLLSNFSDVAVWRPWTALTFETKVDPENARLPESLSKYQKTRDSGP